MVCTGDTVIIGNEFKIKIEDTGTIVREDGKARSSSSICYGLDLSGQIHRVNILGHELPPVFEEDVHICDVRPSPFTLEPAEGDRATIRAPTRIVVRLPARSSG